MPVIINYTSPKSPQQFERVMDKVLNTINQGTGVVINNFQQDIANVEVGSVFSYGGIITTINEDEVTEITSATVLGKSDKVVFFCANCKFNGQPKFIIVTYDLTSNQIISTISN